MLEQGGGACAVDEDDGGFFRVCGRQEQDVEIAFLVGEGDLEVALGEGVRDGEVVGVDLADEDGWFRGGARHLLEGADFGGDCGGEEAGLSLVGGGKDGEAGLYVGEHGAVVGVL